MKLSFIRFDSPLKASLVTVNEEIHLKADEVLIASDYSVISAGTEVANLKGMPNTSGQFPWHPGYSGSGRVLEVGSAVENLKPDDRVIVNWAGHRSHVVKKAVSISRIDDDSIDMLDAAFAHIASFSFLGVRKLRLELGESAMIIGQGILGAFATQIAKLAGAFPVIVTDFDCKRRELALRLGAEHVFSPDEEKLPDKIKEFTDGKGVDAIVEVTGVAAALRQALECVAWQGRVSLLGCTRISDVNIDFYQYVHRRGIALIGAHTFTRPGIDSRPGEWTERDDYRTFLKFVAAGRIQTRPLISEIVSPADATQVYLKLAEMKNPPLGVVFDWNKIKN
jgi:2-desacetyl-2-hydroxyethyl bacteriochlorophyllide A dehydrogenase